MVRRTSSSDVVFVRPFILDGMDAVQPAGTYTVETETDEDSLDTVFALPWRRVLTVMRIARPGHGTEYVPVSPERLHEALMRDGAQQDPALPFSSARPKSWRDGRAPSAHTPRNRH